MKKIFGLLLILILSSCGQKSDVVSVKGNDGATGTNGTSGRDGNSGANGYSIVTKVTQNPALCGDAGGNEVFMALDLDRNLEFSGEDEVQSQYVVCNGKDGLNGEDGVNGQAGQNGLNGTSCSVNKVNNISTITCGNSSSIVVDGSKGDKGDTGSAGANASGIYIAEIINPCGVEFNNDEVFLRLSTGRILALYDGGPNEDRLALIAPGNYITTDAVQNKSCSFTVTNDYKITNEVRH